MNIKVERNCQQTRYRPEIFPEFRKCPDLRGHSRGNPRSGLIFMGGGGGGGGVVGTINCVYFATQSLIIPCIHHSL